MKTVCVINHGLLMVMVKRSPATTRTPAGRPRQPRNANGNTNPQRGNHSFTSLTKCNTVFPFAVLVREKIWNGFHSKICGVGSAEGARRKLFQTAIWYLRKMLTIINAILRNVLGLAVVISNVIAHLSLASQHLTCHAVRSLI